MKLRDVVDHVQLRAQQQETLAELLTFPVKSPEYNRLFNILVARIADDEGLGPHPKERLDEARWVALVHIVVDASQEGEHQRMAFRELLAFLIPTLDRKSRRWYLPSDEVASISIGALARVRENNFENLRKFLRDRFDKLCEAPTAGKPKPKHGLSSWLRLSCKAEISYRLRWLWTTGLVAGDQASQEAIDQKERSTTLLLHKLCNAQDAELRRLRFVHAEAELDSHQRRAIALYFAMRGGTMPEGCDPAVCAQFEALSAEWGTHQRVRAAYMWITSELRLRTTPEAEKVVKTAKQRLKTVLERMSDIELSNDNEEEV